MEGIFFVKHVGQMQSITSQKSGEQVAKLSIVLSTKEVRSSDNGSYAIDQDFCIDLLGERATGFTLQPNDWITASLSFTAKTSTNGGYFQDIRMNRYCKL